MSDLSSPKYLPLARFSEVYGYSANAVRLKIHKSQWLEGREYRYDPDGKIQIIIKGYEAWVEKGQASRHGVPASASGSHTKAADAASC